MSLASLLRDIYFSMTFSYDTQCSDFGMTRDVLLTTYSVLRQRKTDMTGGAASG